MSCFASFERHNLSKLANLQQFPNPKASLAPYYYDPIYHTNAASKKRNI